MVYLDDVGTGITEVGLFENNYNELYRERLLYFRVMDDLLRKHLA